MLSSYELQRDSLQQSTSNFCNSLSIADFQLLPCNVGKQPATFTSRASSRESPVLSKSGERGGQRGSQIVI
jgi:hypothetical protein